ncbi:MAG: sigma-70 family RNA polymerase sigma factor [Chthoniobacteraceae bacterium]
MSQPESIDSELIALAQSGDADAFSTLTTLHEGRLLCTALTLTRDAHLAEDIVQETFTEAWRSLARFDGRCRFTTWLHAILVHRSYKAVRHAASRPRLPTPHEGSQPEAIDPHSPAHAALQREAAEQLRDAVAALPGEHRAVIELRFFADCALDEIAAALDVPLGTVKSRLHHALEKLRGMNLFAAARES